ncbi:hypothetical protein FJT64_010149 [Amphibalanus amphitrite]|uniref:EF-hand domain-containing protein n=1 Tax=Amphibalanus amphitrite TaxID=1232801 RepID=A0A6A4VRB2_AMPAM|nr:hypothetical protein FJT64_010149 [Amphibalanus amphitrite]
MHSLQVRLVQCGRGQGPRTMAGAARHLSLRVDLSTPPGRGGARLYPAPSEGSLTEPETPSPAVERRDAFSAPSAAERGARAGDPAGDPAGDLGDRLGEPSQLRRLRWLPGDTPPMQRALSRMEIESLRDRKRLAHLRELERLLRLGAHQEPSRRLSIRHRPELTADQFTELMQLSETADHLFGLFDWDGAGFLDQQEWIEFLKEKIDTGHDRELVEVIETAAYLVCGLRRVDRDRFGLIVAAKGVGPKLYRAVQERGHVTVKRIMEFIANLSNASRPGSSRARRIRRRRAVMALCVTAVPEAGS